MRPKRLNLCTGAGQNDIIVGTITSSYCKCGYNKQKIAATQAKDTLHKHKARNVYTKQAEKLSVNLRLSLFKISGADCSIGILPLPSPGFSM